MLGFRDVFTSSSSAWCTQHIKARNAEQLRIFGANKNDISKIMSDIYSAQSDIVLQNGLADAYDAEDFKMKLLSLEDIWKEAVPKFYDWFLKNRCDLFVDCLALDARKNLGITERFSTNGLENQDKLQKRSIKEAGIHKEVVAVSKQLKEWSDDYFREAERALYINSYINSYMNAVGTVSVTNTKVWKGNF